MSVVHAAAGGKSGLCSFLLRLARMRASLSRKEHEMPEYLIRSSERRLRRSVIEC